MISLAMIRHGPTDWNKDRRLQGRTDVPLSAEGRDAAVRWRLSPGVLDYRPVSSPLLRAVETAALLGMEEPEIESRIQEMDYGEWEGQSLDDLRRDLGQEMADNETRGLDFRAPGGESPREVQARLTPWLAEVAARGKPTVAVSHHGVLRALLSLATGWPMTGNPPEKVIWGAIHYFELGDSGKIAVDRLNVSMEPT